MNMNTGKKMQTDSLSNVCGNFQELRDLWSSKAQTKEKPLRPTLVPLGPLPEKRQEEKKSPKVSIPILKITNDTTLIAQIKKEPPATPNNERPTIFECVQKLPPTQGKISLPNPPPPPPSIIVQHPVLEGTIKKMVISQKKNVLFKISKNTGIHHWHIARHVFRSGLIFRRRRRASDSILPLLMKTHETNHHPRTNSMESTFSQTPFESLIDYITYNKDNDKDSLAVPTKIKRSASDESDCMRRNKLDDSIFQYEMILRHLKNYEQFKTTYPPPPSSTSLSISSKHQKQSFDNEPNNPLNEIEEKFLARTSIPNRQTQSLSRNVGRTFSEFIMNDLFLLPSSKSSSKEQRYLSISHSSSQTDVTESIDDINDQTNDSNKIVPLAELNRINSTSNEEAKAVLNELDAVLDNKNQESLITPNSEINVIVRNSSVLARREEETLPREKPLMQRLFEGKKTAYSPDDLNMESLRIPEEMMVTYETAKKTCFFDSEQIVYGTKMMKIRRQKYTQHLRLLFITTQRLYNITKRDPYPKEGLFLKDILGITCTPYKDGFVCIHTKEVFEDRGDWLVVVDHPCEFVTQLFMTLGRDNNDDNFLKFESKFKHIRRWFGEACSSECMVEVHLADSFRIKKADFDTLFIFTP